MKFSFQNVFKKSQILLVLKISIIFILLWTLVKTSQLKFELLIHLFDHAFLLFYVIFLFILMVIVSAWRWKLLNASQGIHLSLFNTFIPSYLGVACTNVLPSAVSGDLVRAYYICKKLPEMKNKIFTCIFFDRIMGFLGIGVAILLVIILKYHSIQQNNELFSLTVLCEYFCLGLLPLLILLIIFFQRIGFFTKLLDVYGDKQWLGPVVSFLHLVSTFRMKSLLIIGCITLSVLLQILIVSSLIVITKMMDLPALGFSDGIIAIGITQLVGVIPLTPGGIGVAELVYANVLLLLNPGISSSFATVFLGYRLISALTYLPGAIFYIVKKIR